jgi:hypothetical protein
MDFAPEVILDIGAHRGEWSDAALAKWPSARFILLEPSAELFVHLEAKYKDRENVTVLKLAASNVTSQNQQLFSDQKGSGLASLTKRRLEHFNLTFNFTEVIQVSTLSKVCSELGILAIDILKIDVEGEELNVLLGAKELLSKIRIVQFEFGGCNIDSRTFFQDFWYLLKPLNFEIYRLSPRGLIKIRSYHETDETFTTTNFLATANR